MRDAYQITITLDVTDPRQLFDAALQRFHAENPGTPVGEPDAYRDYIGTRAQPDISGCLTMLADPGASWPGTSIDGSSAEFQASNDDDAAEPQAPAFEPGARVLFTSTCSDATTPPDTPAEVVRALTEDEADAEVGPMYQVRTDDGAEYDAFEDELSPTA
ncbi:hypothetical protein PAPPERLAPAPP_01340 [Brevundimonas phage vB_BpoS-Papperlapapp]|nr:hypothetical protein PAPPERLAPAPP_01340 [Brevundimonas phage vB_BpoS-Papperlapapp]